MTDMNYGGKAAALANRARKSNTHTYVQSRGLWHVEYVSKDAWSASRST
ncbi:hypothetical protein SAMN02745898_11879 [Streptomyces sp. 136MFCol5.1]|nr:hypothetical protein SAMN02745898_11879 [Streptomyces sp. 136MFCol5.1]SFT30000.1 hypothetical protein SAMN04487982_11574 [Streptomyces sp. ok210]